MIGEGKEGRGREKRKGRILKQLVDGFVAFEDRDKGRGGEVSGSDDEVDKHL